jgi:hypothetical protein
MVVAGSTRSDNNTPVKERTKVFEFQWPGPAGDTDIKPVWVEGAAAPDTGNTGTTPPAPPAGGGGSSVNLGPILERLSALETTVAALKADKAALEMRLEDQEKRVIPTKATGMYVKVFGATIKVTDGKLS